MVAILFLVVLSLIYFILSRRKRYAKLPPGPQPYPIVGNLPQLLGKNIQEEFRKYRKLYGNIFTVHIFSKIIIVVNGSQELKGVFARNGNHFSERPHPYKFGADVLKSSRSIGLFPSSGDIWKINKRIINDAMKELTAIKGKLQVYIREEIPHLLDSIEKHHGEAFDISDSVKSAISNVLSRLLLGRRFAYSANTPRDFVNRVDDSEWDFVCFKSNWMKYIPGDPFKIQQYHDSLNNLLHFFDDQVKEHSETYDKNITRDFIDHCLKHMGKGEDNSQHPYPLNEKELSVIIQDLYVAGLKPTASSVLFGIVFLIRQPHIQTRIFEELKGVVPANRNIEFTEKQNMPYTEATILEILRLGSVLPFGCPRTVIKDFVHNRYTIPESVCIIPNLNSILKDGAVWEEPFFFKPTRFLNECTSNRIGEASPFSVGTRTCPGETAAVNIIFVFIASLLQRFELLPPEGQEPPNLESKSATAPEPTPFKLRAIKRIK